MIEFKMTRPEPTSADRFLWSRGSALLGYRGPRGGAIAMMIGGGCALLAGIGVIVGAVITGDRGLGATIASTVAMTAGFPLLFGGISMFRKHRDVPDSEVRLSKEAKALVVRLATHIGWTEPQQQANWNVMWMGEPVFKKKSVQQQLSEEAFLLLEGAAQQYNRLHALVAGGAMRSDPTLRSQEATVRAAGEEAMILVLNSLATMDKFPEASQEARHAIESRRTELRELADHVGRMSGSGAPIEEGPAEPSLMVDLLERLRFDEAARRELREEPDPERRHEQA